MFCIVICSLTKKGFEQYTQRKNKNNIYVILICHLFIFRNNTSIEKFFFKVQRIKGISGNCTIDSQTVSSLFLQFIGGKSLINSQTFL